MTDLERIADILASWHERRAMGVDVDAEELLKSHPELADELRASLESLEVLNRAFSSPAEQTKGHPSNIGPYRILKEIGRGGMGVVYEAEQTSMERRVALKVLSPSITNAARSIKRFKLEAKAAGKLHHTNIVPVHDMGQHAGYWYYAMELVEGRPLSEILDDLRSGGYAAESTRAQVTGSTMSVEEGSRQSTSHHGQASGDGQHWYRTIASMFAGVAEALERAHDEGIVHRDVKPANLLLHTDGTLKLVDFGLAHLEGNGPTMTRTGDFLGTPAYMSPEQAAAKGVQVDHRTDTYSLGAALYEVLTLKPPFEGENLAQLCSRIASLDPAVPRTVNRRIPKDLETIVLKAMEKDRRSRYQRAGDLARDLHAFCDGGVIRARRIGLMGRLWRRVKRHKVPASLTAAVLVLSASGAVLAWRLAVAERNAEYGRLLFAGQLANPSSVARVVGLETEAQPDSDHMSWGIFTDAIALDRDRPEAYWLRALTPGDVNTRLRDVDAAQTRGLTESTAHWLKAILRVLQADFDQADRERALAESLSGKQSPEEAYAEAIFLDLRGEKERALELTTAAIDGSRPGEIIHYLGLRFRERLFRALGSPEQALRDLHAMEVLGDDGVGVRIQIARIWDELGRRVEATELFERALRETRQKGDAASWIALTRTNLGQWRDRVSNEALLDHSESKELLVFRAASLRSQERLDEALEHSRRAIAVDSSFAEAYYQLGEAYRMKLEHEKALEAFDTALELQEPSASAELYAHVGRTLGAMHELERAEVAFERALDLQPYFPQLYEGRGVAYGQNGEYGKAIENLNEAIKLDPRFGRAWFNLGLAYELNGEIDKAIDAYITSNQIRDPIAPRVTEAHVNLGLLYCRIGEFDKGIESLRTALKKNPRLVGARFNLASAFFQKRLLDQARDEYQKVIELRPQHAGALYNLARISALQERKDEALKWLADAVKAGYKNVDEVTQNSDLDTLRNNPKYEEILELMRSRYSP